MEKEVEAIANRLEEEMVLSLSEEALDEADMAYENALVVKVSGGEVPSREGLVGLLKKLWKPSEGVEFKGLTDDMLVVVFVKKEERTRVLWGGPWLFNDWVILIDEWRSDKLVSEINLSKFNIWVQIHNLPLGYTKGKPLEDVAAAIGDVIQIQVPSPSKKGMVAPVKYVRVFVQLDVTVPAKYGFF